LLIKLTDFEMINSKKLSIILLSYYSSNKLIDVYDKLAPILKSENIPFELVIMDDGSKDDSFKIARELEKKNPEVKAFQLSRNYTSFYSIFAGLSVVDGACATMIPDDEQQPYSSLIEMYRLWENGEKVVIPYRENRDESWGIRFFSKLFYKIMNLVSDINYPYGGADICLIDREVINILNSKIHPINTAIIPEVLRLGFDPYFLPYSRSRGTNEKSRWSFKKKLKLANDIFFSSSSFPIRFIIYMGLFFSSFAFMLIIFYTYIKVLGNSAFWGNLIPGWTSIILFISFFSGLILLSLGVIAKYIWLIFEEVKNRPGYIIKK
jgi:dolichol-phosphate mannosyltransferase